MLCPECQSENHDKANFCNECGYKFDLATENIPKQEIKGERKHATVLFSDLSGYTAMTERMDPEDVKNLMEDIFEKAGKIVEKYQGTVDSFFGDEILVLFGVPKAHEDDPIRAIHTAIEIHKLVEELSPEFEKRNLGKLSMHTGIDSGLVITGDKFIGKGRQGLAGDTINLASRLTGLAKPGEIIVGQETYKNAENHFSFKSLDPVMVKGKKNPLKTFQVINAVGKPKRTKQLHGVRAELIGRDKELSIFSQAVTDLKNGNSCVFCLYGFAGTGKSRLIEEFKAITSVQWFEGYSYPYTKNFPYFPLLTLFDDIFGIKEEDSSNILKAKIEKSINSLIRNNQSIIPYIGTLYSLNYPEVENVSPESWKLKLFNAVLEILSAIARQQPTIICIEDLHWADPSFLELIHFIESKVNLQILFLYVARPVIEIFTHTQKNQLETKYQEIWIEDLSASDSQIMVKSLLNSESIPQSLKNFVETKTQGNPFYLEEMINSLIESKVLQKKDNEWLLQREVKESDISSSIQGVITARVDRLESESKRILQEAAVIGRSFYYEIISKITEIKKDINLCLENLEGFDLIKSRESKMDLEYMFKHALTQEVVYNGLLKAERRVIHEKIGQVIEQVFNDRLSEFYETLAHHFSKGRSTLKAVDYLMKSGDKSLKKYSLDESHQYYTQAFDLLSKNTGMMPGGDELLIDLILDWALVFYYRGDGNGLAILLTSVENLTASLGDQKRLGMLYAWTGYVMFWREQYQESFSYLKKALKIGETINSSHVVGYACAWLPFVCAEMGRFKEGIAYGERAQKIEWPVESDKYVYLKSLMGIAYIHFFRGMKKEMLQLVEPLEDESYNLDPRFIGMIFTGYGLSHLLEGNYALAIEQCNKAVQSSSDPIYSTVFRNMLGFCYLVDNNFEKAGDEAQKVVIFSRESGIAWIGSMAEMILGIVFIANGQFSKGMNKLKKVQCLSIKNKRQWLYAQSEYIMGGVYLSMVQKSAPLNLSIIIKNTGFLIKNLPFAAKKAENHFKKSIESAEKMGANSILGQACLDLGRLYKAKKKKKDARECFKKAIDVFELCEIESFKNQAKEEILSL